MKARFFFYGLLGSAVIQAAAFAYYPDATVSGTYSVPVPTALAPFAAFDIKYVYSKDTNGKLGLSYSLPEELVGKNKPCVELKETARSGGLVSFSGEHGRGSCRISDKRMICFIIYPDYDTSGAEDAIRQKYSSAPQAEVDSRLQVMQLFGADPAGVVSFDR